MAEYRIDMSFEIPDDWIMPTIGSRIDPKPATAAERAFWEHHELVCTDADPLTRRIELRTYARKNAGRIRRRQKQKFMRDIEKKWAMRG